MDTASYFFDQPYPIYIYNDHEGRCKYKKSRYTILLIFWESLKLSNFKPDLFS